LLKSALRCERSLAQVAHDASPHGNHAELGSGRRAPKWVHSAAQVSLPAFENEFTEGQQVQ
jgi:hypothetical protein